MVDFRIYSLPIAPGDDMEQIILELSKAEHNGHVLPPEVADWRDYANTIMDQAKS